MELRGKRVFLNFTGEELPAVLPINKGKPVGDFWFTLLGTVTDEHSHGIWFRLERLWVGDTENKRAEPDEYFIPWTSFKRPILAREPDTSSDDLRPPPGLYL